MSVVTLTVYEHNDPPKAAGGAVALGTITDAQLERFAMRRVISTKGFHSLELEVNRHDPAAALLVTGRWVTVDIPILSADPVLTVRLGPNHTTVLSEDEEAGEILQAGGLGFLSLFKRARLLETTYAPSPPASAERGSSTIPGLWHWRTQPRGAIMVRGVEEGQHQPGEPLGDVVITFTRSADSNGTAWPALGEQRYFEQRTTIDLWDLYGRLAESGTLYLVERDGLALDSYGGFGSASFGVDRTSATFAADKVRLVSDPASDFSNMLTGLEEEGEEEPYSHIIVAGGSDTFVTRVASWYVSGPGHWAAIDYPDSDDPVLLADVGDEFLARSFARNEAREVEISPGDDPLNGLYLPAKHFKEGDLGTLDAGGIDEPVRIIAWRIELAEAVSDATPEDAARSLRVVVELDEVLSSDGPEPNDRVEAGNGGGAGKHRHTHPETLCQPAVEAAPDVLFAWDWDDGLAEPVPEISSLSQPATTSPSGGWTINAGGYLDNRATTGNLPNTNQTEAATAIVAGTDYTLTAVIRNADPGVILSATIALTWSSGNFGAYVGISNTPAIDIGENGTFTEVSGTYTAPVGATSVQVRVGGGVEVNSVSLAGPATGGSPNDGHADLVGTGSRSARCGHRHDVHRDTAPTVNDDETLGYKLGTIWARLDSLVTPTAIVGVWMLVKTTAGAAVWLELPPGLTEAEVQSLIDNAVATHAAAADPHAGYQRESEKGFANGYAALGAGALVPMAQLATGTPDGTKFVRDDGTLAVPAGGGGSGSGAHAATIGDGVATSITVTHSLGTTDLVIELWDVSGVNPVLLPNDHADYPTSITAGDTNNVTLLFGTAPATASRRVVIVAGGSTSPTAPQFDFIDVVSVSIASGTKAIVHSSLDLTFAAPASGRVMLHGGAVVGATALSDAHFYCQLDAGADQFIGAHQFNGASAPQSIPLGLIITGLTPGQSYVAHMRWARAGSGTLTIDAGTRGGAQRGTWWMVVPLP